MRIYVGTYAKYNNGDLTSEWVDITDFTSKEDFYAYCAELHEDEADPEFMFQDYEEIPDCFISESWVSDLLWEIPDHIDMEAFTAFIDLYGPTLDDEIFDHFEESYQGEFESEMAYAEYIFDELYAHSIPENMRYYIDYEKFARDLFIDGYSFSDGYVFSDNW